MAAPSIRAEGLWKEYQLGERRYAESLRADLLRRLGRSVAPPRERFWAVRDVSFEVQPGEVLGVLGANGSGKSTLLRILSGITEPTRGWAEIRGRVGSLLEVGTGFHPELSGRENVYLQGSILGLSYSEVRGRFDQIVEFSELQAFLDTPVKRYSSGMYVRLAFAVAAHLDTDVLLVDEVLAVGDASFRRKCSARMREVAAGGTTVLFVSHDLSAVEALCGRALWMEAGRAVASGAPAEVVSRYLSQALGGASAVDLADHPGRSGGTPLLRRFELLDDQGRPCESIRRGEPLRLRVGLELPAELGAATLQVRLRSELGPLVAMIGTRDGAPLRLPAGRVWLEGRMPGVELAAGIYALGVQLLDADRSLDRVEDALRLRVASPARGSGWHVGGREHAWLAPSEWSVAARE